MDSVLRSAPAGGVEIVVVDDASGDASAEVLSTPAYSGQPIRVVRNDVHRGLIFSRARAAELARGRYLVFLDAHCAVEPGWLEAMAAELAAIDDRGLVVPLIHGLEPANWTLDFEKGATDGCTISNPFLDFAWTAPEEIDGRLATCTIGGGAWMCGRQWYELLGGLDRGMVHWGGENIDFPLRTWLAGGTCLVAPRARIGHLFKDTPSPHLASADFIYNKIRAAHNAFGAEMFERVMDSLRHFPGFRDAITRIHAERSELGEAKDRFESLRKRSDRWLVDTFRLPLLEPAFFHFAPRRQTGKAARAPRPLVSVVASAATDDGDLEPLLASVLEKTSYGNCELVLARGEGRENGRGQGILDRDPWRDHPRLRSIRSSMPLDGGRLENLVAGETGADYLAFLPPGAVILDPHWLEKLLLLAEKRPRLLLACPRARRIGAGGLPEPGEDRFDALWDWDAPLFTRDRRGEPLSEDPYQALSSPDGVLFVHRDRFLELGGLDRTVRRGPRPVMDLAVAGWLAGYEVFCHPGVAIGLAAERLEPARGGEPALERWRQYSQALPAVKSFSDQGRLARCLERSPLAQPLLVENRRYLEGRRRDLERRARFDDDWLFHKFAIEDIQ